MNRQITMVLDDQYGYLYAHDEFGVGVRVHDRFGRRVGRIVCWQGEIDPDAPPEISRALRTSGYGDGLVIQFEVAPITQLQWWRRTVAKVGLSWSTGCSLATLIHQDLSYFWWFVGGTVVHALALTYEWMVVDRIRPRAESD